jgi:hypothetical protein
MIRTTLTFLALTASVVAITVLIGTTLPSDDEDARPAVAAKPAVRDLADRAPAASVPADGPVVPAVTAPYQRSIGVFLEPQGDTVARGTSTLTAPEKQRLVANLQAQLARVGCYTGQSDGAWGATSQRAMAEFAHGVNARINVDQPDPMFLILAEQTQGRVCAKAQCSGQDGECAPVAVVAPLPAKSDGSWQANVKPVQSIKAVEPVTAAAATAVIEPAAEPTPVEPRPPLPRAMSVGAPPPDDARPDETVKQEDPHRVPRGVQPSTPSNAGRSSPESKTNRVATVPAPTVAKEPKRERVNKLINDLFQDPARN